MKPCFDFIKRMKEMQDFTKHKRIDVLRNRGILENQKFNCIFCMEVSDIIGLREAIKEKLPWITYFGKFICSNCVFALNIAY